MFTRSWLHMRCAQLSLPGRVWGVEGEPSKLETGRELESVYYGVKPALLANLSVLIFV